EVRRDAIRPTSDPDGERYQDLARRQDHWLGELHPVEPLAPAFEIEKRSKRLVMRYAGQHGGCSLRGGGFKTVDYKHKLAVAKCARKTLGRRSPAHDVGLTHNQRFNSPA